MSRHHAIDYIEFSTHDLPATKQFYADVFGWSFTDYGPGYAGIKRIAATGSEMGGIAQVDPSEESQQNADPAVPAPIVIIYSNDLDATFAAVRRFGGTIHTPTFDFPGGRRFHFIDPSGSQLAVWSEE